MLHWQEVQLVQKRLVPGFLDLPDSYYLGKKVQIIGIIKKYKGSPEIIVKTPDQIKIIS